MKAHIIGFTSVFMAVTVDVSPHAVDYDRLRLGVDLLLDGIADDPSVDEGESCNHALGYGRGHGGWSRNRR